MAKNDKITYSEPSGYLPKEIMEKFFGKQATKKTSKKPTSKKK